MVVPSTSRRLIFTPAARRYNNNNTKQVMHTLEKVIEKPRCIEKEFGFNKCDETKWNYVMFAGIGNVPSAKSGQGAIIKERGRRFGACTHYTAGKNIIHCLKTTYDCLSDNFAVMMRERLKAEGKYFISCLNC